MAKEHRQQTWQKREVRTFLEKIVINAGIGRLSQQPNFSAEGPLRPRSEASGSASGGEAKKSILSQVMRDMALMTGQKPEARKAKKSISGFKMREGQIVGLRVTLRRRKMVDFFERLIRIVLPRVRDFRGLEILSVDAGGTLSIGIREQLVFPEINPEESPVIFPLGVNIVPRIKSREEAIKEYRRLGVPLK